MKIKKGDKVIVITGKDKGVRGEVLQTAPKVRKILVEGVNLVKKHIKAQESKKGGKVGQRIELPTFINISNAQLVCPNCGKSTRVGYEATDKGKFRICKKCGKMIEEKTK
jgi:large subunit ribosomal protein L24